MNGCTLQFTRSCPLRTTLVDEATGRAKYKIDTPIRISGSVTQIRKLESENAHDWDESDDDSDDGFKNPEYNSEKEEGLGREMTVLPESGLSGMSDEIARIYWHWFSADRIIFRGMTTTRDEFLPKCGKMKGSFTFTGPDGVHYRWALGALGLNYPKLVTTDEKKVIAEFHRAHHITRREKAKLEVQPAGMHMLDHIVLTFVVVEQIRREREA